MKKFSIAILKVLGIISGVAIAMYGSWILFDVAVDYAILH